jgi:hypothetical protein
MERPVERRADDTELLDVDGGSGHPICGAKAQEGGSDRIPEVPQR